MGQIGVVEVVVVVLIVIVLFGAKKLPEMARAVAKAINEFRKESQSNEEDK